jgi:ferredoxin, 2Fe-2S
MATITFIESDGTAHAVEARCGWSLMENATKNDVPGIVAECGGSQTCGTCRIYVSDEWQAKMDSPTAGELAIIEFAEDRTPGARLSCQIEMRKCLNGLVVHMPKRQYSM